MILKDSKPDMLSELKYKTGSLLADYLTKTVQGYRRFDTISIEAIAAVLEPGDVLLIEGNSRISIAIKYLTQSSWSHACLYIGSEASPLTDNCLLEADLKEGVQLVQLSRYAELNLRICRPVGLTPEEMVRLLEFAKSKIGHRYDLKNIWDLIRYLIQKPAVPNRYRRSMIGFGSGEPTRAICSTMIAESFQQVNYPILPRRGPIGDDGEQGEVPTFYRRHFTHYTPRDFDVSPYFRIIKPTIETGFDFRSMQWVE